MSPLLTVVFKQLVKVAVGIVDKILPCWPWKQPTFFSLFFEDVAVNSSEKEAIFRMIKEK